MTDVENFINAILGSWQGNEEIIADPETMTKMGANATFTIRKALGNTGYISSYTQTINGSVSMYCETLFRFNSFEDVIMIWLPSDGEPQNYNGSMTNDVLIMKKLDDDGVEHQLMFDYSNTSRMTCKMTINLPGCPSMTMFSGDYEKVS